MVLTWAYIFLIIMIITLTHPVLSVRAIENHLGHAYNFEKTRDPSDWTVIEALAEDHPYLVAILNITKDYICTGSIIRKQCVLTSGSCITNNPKYVVNSALYSKRDNNNMLFNVYYTSIHSDYIYDLNIADPNATKLHSNIGLVFVDRPFLELFINVADVGNYYASELRGKKMKAIGYGYLAMENTVALQYQTYLHIPCINPKWYYCVCGKEFYTGGKTYIDELGVGAPIMLESVLVGITAAPCGKLYTADPPTKYNIFTVVGPYLPWIEKRTTLNSTRKIGGDDLAVIVEYTDTETNTNGVCNQHHIFMKQFHILILISKMFF